MRPVLVVLYIYTIHAFVYALNNDHPDALYCKFFLFHHSYKKQKT